MIRALFAKSLSLLTLCASVAVAQDYVGSETCADCHTAEAAAWRDSHHAWAWTEASDDTVRADFNDTRFDLGEMHAEFSRDAEGRFIAQVTELDGQTRSYPVHSVVGIEPLQQYLLETEEGRLQSFDVVWDTEAEEWFHLYPDQTLPPDDGLHWSGPYKSWNGRCATCHTTGYSAQYDPARRTYASSWSEIAVGCEACHGPGADHVAWVTSDESDAPANAGFATALAGAEAHIDMCGGCHSRREAFFDGTPPPGISYHDAYALSALRPGLYWPDGQIRDEVYVLGSFLQSKMHHKGVTCSDCHNSHSGQLLGAGNSVCTQCHSLAGNPDFASLPLRAFDSPAHHRHPEGSAGAECKACHMPEQTYMGNDLRADHSFRIPRPDLNAATGAPDACTACHTGQSADWAAEVLEDWFPQSTKRGPHYGTVLAQGQTVPQGDLAKLALDSSQPVIVRATALQAIASVATPHQAEQLADLLMDPAPMVRAAAIEAQRNAPAMESVPRITALLGDESRLVRMAAARALIGAPVARLPERLSKELQTAQAEYQASLRARLDFPETHIQLGGIALTTRNFPAAAQAFGEVTELDPQNIDAWIMQIRIAAALGDAATARDIVDRALQAIPEQADLLGLRSQLP